MSYLKSTKLKNYTYRLLCKKGIFRPGQKVPDLAPEPRIFFIKPLILHRTWSSCGNSMPCSRRRDTARRRWERPGPTVLTWLSSSSTAAGSFSTVQFRYPYSAPNYSLSLSRELSRYFRQKCTVFFSVVDAKSLYPDPATDPDPAFQVNPDTAEKKIILFWSKISICLSLLSGSGTVTRILHPAIFFPCHKRAMFYSDKSVRYFSVLWMRNHYIRIRIWVRFQHFKWIRIQLEKKLSSFDQKLQFAYLYCLVQVPLPVFCT